MQLTCHLSTLCQLSYLKRIGSHLSLFCGKTEGEGRAGHHAKCPICIGRPCQEQVVLALQEVQLNWKGLQRIPILQMLRRVVICSPGSLQLAVTPVGQFPTCIPHGNEALNLFSWKQLVSQIQMPICVLSAHLLGECWINFFNGFGSGFEESCVGGQAGEWLGLFLQEFGFLSYGGKRKGAGTLAGTWEQSWQV